ncbi:hypothetical protein [Actinomadura sp. 6N118]|uniref:hypothetical protein n=1 Tax=Actinomadura sp. 6N118 TaxID=3375151 RepID=UPI0037B84CD6
MGNTSGSDFSSLVNQDTPFAPANKKEVKRRISSSAVGDEEQDSLLPAEEVIDMVELSSLSSAFVPTAGATGPGEQPQYEMRTLEDGTPGLAIFTSSEILLERMGGDQNWSEVPLIELLYLVGRERIGVAVNPRLLSGHDKRVGKDR